NPDIAVHFIFAIYIAGIRPAQQPVTVVLTNQPVVGNIKIFGPVVFRYNTLANILHSAILDRQVFGTNDMFTPGVKSCSGIPDGNALKNVMFSCRDIKQSCGASAIKNYLAV